MVVPDRIRLSGLRVEAAHGVYAEEKLNPQLFLIDVEARLSARGPDDDLATTVDYSQLASQIAESAASDSVDLIETLAQRVAGVCLGFELIDEVEVTVHKPQAPLPVPVSDVSVTITRRRHS